MKYLATNLITNPVSRRLTRSLLVLAGVLAIHAAPAQTISESFENPGSSINGYTTGTITFPSGDWEIKEALSESSSRSFDGDKALRIDDDVAGASITTQATNGIDTVSFYYHRPFSGSGEFVLQKSVGGNTFQNLDTVDYTSVTTPAKAYSYPVEDSSNNIRIRILNDDNTAQLTIDLVEITTFGGQGTSQSLIKPPYTQDFESDTTLADWRSVSLSSDNDWTREEFDGDYFAEMSGFQSDSVNEDWLVSPGFDLSNVTEDYFFSFTSAYNFGGDTFQVKVSTNYDGSSDPTNSEFNWTDITNEFQFSQTGYNEVFSGAYNLNSFNGDTLYIAYQYRAPANDGGTMQIDDITIEQQNPLVINEVLANNQNVNTDGNGENDEWIEIYNPNTTDINLSNYSISDDPADRDKYTLPDTSLGSSEYLIVWADDQSSQGGLHANFTLDASGDEVYLTSNIGSVDSVSFGSQPADTSFGRLPDETGNFQQTFPTPEAENQRLLPAYNIGEVTAVDPQTGEVDSVGVQCKITGIVHGFNRRTDGYEVSLQDSTGGIGLFEFSNVSGYTPQEGDEITVRGEIGQFNGLAQLRPDSIRVVSQNNELFDPVVTDKLSEQTEAVLTTLEDYTVIDTSQWNQGGGAFNVDITNGTDTFIIRVDEAAPLINQGPSLGYFDVTGEGWQYDFDEPYFGGYQLFPETTDAFQYDTNLVVNELLAINNSGQADDLGEQDPWIELYNKGDEPLNPSAYFISDGSGPTAGTRLPDTAIQPGERLMVWADGQTLQQGAHANFELDSAGGTVTLATPYGDVFETVEYGPQSPDTSLARDSAGTGDFVAAEPTFDSANEQFGTGLTSTKAPALNLYPNPVQDVLTIEAEEASFRLQVINTKGQVVQQQRVLDSKATISLGQQPTGLYLIRMQGLDSDWQATKKVINAR